MDKSDQSTAAETIHHEGDMRSEVKSIGVGLWRMVRRGHGPMALTVEQAEACASRGAADFAAHGDVAAG